MKEYFKEHFLNSRNGGKSESVRKSAIIQDLINSEKKISFFEEKIYNEKYNKIQDSLSYNEYFKEFVPTYNELSLQNFISILKMLDIHVVKYKDTTYDFEKKRSFDPHAFLFNADPSTIHKYMLRVYYSEKTVVDYYFTNEERISSFKTYDMKEPPTPDPVANVSFMIEPVTRHIKDRFTVRVLGLWTDCHIPSFFSKWSRAVKRKETEDIV